MNLIFRLTAVPSDGPELFTKCSCRFPAFYEVSPYPPDSGNAFLLTPLDLGIMSVCLSLAFFSFAFPCLVDYDCGFSLSVKPEVEDCEARAEGLCRHSRRVEFCAGVIWNQDRFGI